MPRQIFISYARDDVKQIETLHEDLTHAGFDVFIDLELSGGREWWSSLLERIRRCDVFMPAVSATWLDSAACKLESDYAIDLDRAVFPIFLDEASSKLLPASLAARQGVRFDETDKRSILQLVADLHALPAPPPLPDPLPPAPPAPISYLRALHEKVAVTHETSRSEQELLLVELRRRLGSGADQAELAILLERFRRRDDLNVYVAEAIDDLLAPLDAVRDGTAAARSGREHASGEPSGRLDASRGRSVATAPPATTPAEERGTSDARSLEPDPVAPSASPPADTAGKSTLTWSYVCAAISVLFLPMIFGPIAMLLARRASKQGHPKGRQALKVAIWATMAGVVLGALLLAG